MDALRHELDLTRQCTRCYATEQDMNNGACEDTRNMQDTLTSRTDAKKLLKDASL